MKNLLLATYILLMSFTIANAQHWILVKNKNNIKVFLPQKNNSHWQTFKVIAHINASPEQITNFLANTKLYPQWIDKVTQAKTVSSGKNQFVVWYRISMPFGFNDMDIVLLNKIIRQNNKIIIRLKAVPNLWPKQKNLYRITHAYGYWDIEKSGNGSKIIYVFSLIPEINLPTWLIGSLIAQSPYNTVLNLKHFLENKNHGQN
jgi:hypothetical protein